MYASHYNATVQPLQKYSKKTHDNDTNIMIIIIVMLLVSYFSLPQCFCMLRIVAVGSETDESAPPAPLVCNDPRLSSPSQVLPGQVLRFQGVYEDVNIRLSFSLRSLRKPEGRYAKCCHAASGETLFVPLASRGKFYSVARRSSRSPNHVFPLQQLLRLAAVPLTVRLVSGPLPRIPHATASASQTQ